MQGQFALESLEKHLYSVPETEHLIGEDKQGKKKKKNNNITNKEGRKREKKSCNCFSPSDVIDGWRLTAVGIMSLLVIMYKNSSSCTLQLRDLTSTASDMRHGRREEEER